MTEELRRWRSASTRWEEGIRRGTIMLPSEGRGAFAIPSSDHNGLAGGEGHDHGGVGGGDVDGGAKS
jgi:hypothetical protein